MTVKEIMTVKVTAIGPKTPVSEAAEILHNNNFSGLPVVNEFGTVVGMVTERELFSSDFKIHLPTYIHVLKKTQFIMGGTKLLPYEAGRLVRLRVEEIMSKQIFFVPLDITLEKLAAKFSSEGMSVLPVVDKENKLLGIVSRTDLLKHFSGVAIPGRSKAATRHVDREFDFVEKDIQSRFAYVAKARANIWLTVATVLFVIGFLAGMVYVVNPRVFNVSEEGIEFSAPVQP